jgi:hypothetical protein
MYGEKGRYTQLRSAPHSSQRVMGLRWGPSSVTNLSVSCGSIESNWCEHVKANYGRASAGPLFWPHIMYIYIYIYDIYIYVTEWGIWARTVYLVPVREEGGVWEACVSSVAVAAAPRPWDPSSPTPFKKWVLQNKKGLVCNKQMWFTRKAFKNVCVFSAKQ